MKYLSIALILAAIAGAEFFHELSAGDAPGAAMCMAPAGQDAVRDALLAHLRNH